MLSVRLRWSQEEGKNAFCQTTQQRNWGQGTRKLNKAVQVRMILIPFMTIFVCLQTSLLPVTKNSLQCFLLQLLWICLSYFIFFHFKDFVYFIVCIMCTYIMCMCVYIMCMCVHIMCMCAHACGSQRTTLWSEFSVYIIHIHGTYVVVRWRMALPFHMDYSELHASQRWFLSDQQPKAISHFAPD